MLGGKIIYKIATKEGSGERGSFLLKTVKKTHITVEPRITK